MVTDLTRPRVATHSGRAWLPVAAAGCLLAFGAICAVFVWTPAGQELDQRLLPGPGHRGVLFGPAKSLLAAAPLALIVLLAGVLVTGLVRGRISAALAGLAVAGCSVAGAQLLKTVVLRPDFDVTGSTTHNSFPSGHVAATTGVVCAVLLVLPERAKLWAVPAGALAVAAVGSATMIVGWHRLSDVAGAILLATALGLLAAWPVGERRRVV